MKKRKKLKPKYRCQKCGFEFELRRSAELGWATPCLSCGYVYLDWLNFEEVIKSLGDYGRA